MLKFEKKKSVAKRLIHTCHAALRRGLEMSPCGQSGRSMAGALGGHGMACVKQTRSHCVNQTGKTRSKPLATQHGTCELALRLPGFAGLSVSLLIKIVVLS